MIEINGHAVLSKRPPAPRPALTAVGFESSEEGCACPDEGARSDDFETAEIKRTRPTSSYARRLLLGARLLERQLSTYGTKFIADLQ
jgi:hypothetical protein